MSTPVQQLWNLLDQGELWPDGERGRDQAALLAAVAGRLEKARRHGLSVQESNYLRFLRRTQHSEQPLALARAG